MTSKVKYNGELRTTCTHLRSGNSIETDAPVDNKGKGERFSPTDLVATALASCIVTTIGILGPEHGINIDGAECEVEKIMVPHPRRIGEIKIKMTFPDSEPFTEKQQKMIQHIAETCPVTKTLHPDCKIDLQFIWPA